MFRIKPHTCQRYSEGSNKPCAHQDPETEPEQCLGVSCGGPGQQWTAAGAEALGAADPGMAQALLEEVTIKPPQSRQNLHRTGKKTLGGHKESLVHQHPGERSSDPTRD